MNYLQEWQQSCVDEKLTNLNVISLQGVHPLDYLLYSDDLPRRNDGRVSTAILKKYQHTEEGGWWCSGIDLLTGEEDLWGCFKPLQPRFSGQNKKIKYEHPPLTSTGVFALRVPQHLWEQIAQRYGLSILPQDIDPQQADLGFWQWLINHPSIPLCITEGAKKAGALLSAGYAAIALPGINGGYRTPKDNLGRRIGKSHLIPQLQKLTQNHREIYLAFDQDSKPTTIKAVAAAIKKMGYLLKKTGCTVNVINWQPNLGKGVDDLIANHSQSIFDQVYQQALPLDTWKATFLTRLTYPANTEINCRYLPDSLSIPEDNRLIAIKSPKGTGKTQFLAHIVSQAQAEGREVLVIGHRVKLVQAICQRFGLKYVTERGDNTSSYGLCIDSLHPNSQASFDPQNWSNGLVIIDEIEQVLWHGLNSNTCKSNRVAILKSLKTLIQNIINGGGQIIVADADLSDISIDYLMDLAGIDLSPFIIKNNWHPQLNQTWQVYSYPENTPKRLVKELEQHIREGGKPMVCLSAQKLTSKWGTRTLEAYFKQQFPKAKILRLDSESLADPRHPAYGSMTNLNSILSRYDIVLASPCLETGVSIDISGHFTSVWAIAGGVQTVNSVCQALSRIRQPLPRYIWCPKYGFNQVGNGSTSIPCLLTSSNRLTQYNLKLLQQADFEGIEDLDTGFQAESLLCWAKMAVRVNALMINYRQSILAYLQDEGHQIVDTPILTFTTKKDNPSPSLSEAISAVREENYQAECEAIATATSLSENDYQSLKRKLVKDQHLRHSLRKYELQQRYGLPVTASLVAKDDRGWYKKIRLHYFLTMGRQYLAARDILVARKMIEQSNGSLFLPDFNSSQWGAIIGTMELLGIPQVLEKPQRELKNTNPDLQQMAAIALTNRLDLKATLGIGIAKNASPIMVLRRFLTLIDYKLKYLRCQGSRQKRIRVYQLLIPVDDRQQVFKYWFTEDSNQPGSSELFSDNNPTSPKSYGENCDRNYIQLKLF